MKIAYVTLYDVLDRSSWPKTQLGLCQAGYYIARQLTDLGCELQYVGGLKKKKSVVTKLKWEFYRRFQDKDYYRWIEPSILKNYANQVCQTLKSQEFDVILGAENILPLAFLDTDKPMVLWTDAPLSALINFYPYLSNLCQETQANIYQFEEQAISRCQNVIYTSNWAASSAIKTYNLPESKVSVVPWGANLETTYNSEDILDAIARRSRNTCELLWIGVEWERKGGDFALDVAKTLNQRGLNTILNVVGKMPERITRAYPFVRYFGYLHKDRPEQAKKLEEILLRSHFFIFPTQAESYGHVLCEAHQFGLPCLSNNVGGIPTIIAHQKTGWTFSPSDSPQVYSDVIWDTFQNLNRYREMAKQACDRYHERLNWTVACQSVKQILERITESSLNSVQDKSSQP